MRAVTSGVTNDLGALRTVLSAAVASQERARMLVGLAGVAVNRAAATRVAVMRARRSGQLARERTARLRNEPVTRLVESHRALAQRLAAHFASRGQPLEDLEQVAYVGLVTAAQRFDPNRGVRFATFARATISGEIKKYFRDHAWTVHVPRPVQETYLEARAVTEVLTQELGRAPTPHEIAERIGVTADDVVEALDAANALHVDSIDAPGGDSGDDRPMERGIDEDGFLRVEDRSWLVPALASLPEREREIIRLRFFEGLPQSAIAARVGISQMHVSRLLARSLAQLRSLAPPA